MRAALARLRASAFLRDAALLTFGTAGAQVLPLAVAPLLARMYPVGGFGDLAVFTAGAAILGVPVTLRYAVAILVAKTDDEARAAARLSLGIAVGYALFLLLALLALRPLVATRYPAFADAWWLPLIPVSVLLMGVQQILYTWSNRQRGYRVMAGTKFAQFGIAALAQLVAGAVGMILLGLVVGVVLGQIAAVAVVAGAARDALRASPSATVKDVARTHAHFALFSTPGDLVSAISNQAPVLLLVWAFGDVVGGQYGMTVRVLAAPVALVGGAVREVFQERAAKEYAATGQCASSYRRALRTLLPLAIVPAIVLALAAPAAFAFVFGPEWRESGVFAQLLVPFFVLSFVASPLGNVNSIVGRQREDFLWQVSVLVSTLGALWASLRVGDPRVSLGLFSATYSVMYVVYLWMSYRFSHGETLLPAEGR